MTLPAIAYSRADAAQALGMSVRSLAKAVDSGDLTPRYFGRKPLFLACDLEAFVRTLPSTPQIGGRS